MRSIPTGLAVLAVTLAAAIAAPADRASDGIQTSKELTLAGAKQIAAAGAAEAKRLDAGGALAVVDTGGHVLYVERLDGTFPAAATVAIDKARTAALFRRETRVFEEAIRGGRVSLTGVSALTPLEGGVPIVVSGVVVGAVGVSGAHSSQEDVGIATVAAAALAREEDGHARR